MDHQRNDDPAREASMEKCVRKRFKKYPPKILVNLSVNPALALNLREIGIETGDEPVTQALTALLIVPLGKRALHRRRRQEEESARSSTMLPHLLLKLYQGQGRRRVFQKRGPPGVQ